LANHHVWNFNATGPAVESYSSFLYAGLSTIPALLHWNPLIFFKLLAVLVVVIFLVRLKMTGLATGAFISLCVLSLGNPLFVLNMWSGLETTLTILLLVAAISIVSLDKIATHPKTFLLLLLAISFVRSEGILYALAVVFISLPAPPWRLSKSLWLVWVKDLSPLFLKIVLPLVLANLTYLILRRWHFGEWGTGPSWAKFAQADKLSNIEANFWSMFLFAGLTLFVILLLNRGVQRTRLLIFLTLTVLIYSAIFLPSRLLMGTFNRFEMMAFWPIILASILIWGFEKHLSRSATMKLTLATFVCLIFSFHQLNSLYAVNLQLNAFSQLKSAHGNLGLLLHDSFPRDTIVVMDDIGLAPYQSDLQVADPVGLALPVEWRSGGPLEALKNVRHGVLILPGKSDSDLKSLLTAADGGHALFDPRTSQAWALDHNYAYLGSLPFYYNLQVWVSPALASKESIKNAFNQSRCQATETTVAQGLVEQVFGPWALESKAVHNC